MGVMASLIIAGARDMMSLVGLLAVKRLRIFTSCMPCNADRRQIII